MKRSVLFLFAAALCMASPAFAETTIGVVNIQQIMQQSKAANSVRTQLKEKQKAFQADLDSKEKAFYAEKDTLSKEAKTTEKVEFEKKLKAFSDKTIGEQRDIQTKKMKIEKAFADGLAQIQTNVMTIVKEVAAEKKLNVVMNGGQLLYADSALDITAEVQKRLDSRLPTVKVNF